MTNTAHHASRPAAFAFVFVTVVLDMLAIGIVIPVLPRLVVALAGGTAEGARVLGLFGTVWALMQFVVSPLSGALSDRFGRRPVILASNFGLGLDYLVMALAPSLGWLFVGRVISGITAASVSTAYAYVADVTPPEARAGRFGMLGAGFGLGFVLGPALGGVMGDLDPRLPFWIAAALSLVNGMYGLLVLPESLPPGSRPAWSWRRANPLGALGLLRGDPVLGGLAVVNFLSYLGHAALPAVGVLYMMQRYGFGGREVGLAMAAVGVAMVVVQATVTARAVKRFGERATLVFGLACGALGLMIIGLAATAPVFFLGMPVMALWGLVNPSSQGLMSRRVSPQRQGELQGANASVTGIANLIGPGLFTQAFAAAIGLGVPGMPYLIAAALTLAAMLMAAGSTGAGADHAGRRNDSSLRVGKS